MNFLKTNNEVTAIKLRSLNYKELPKEGSFFVFVNKTGKLDFAEDKNIVYTDKLFL